MRQSQPRSSKLSETRKERSPFKARLKKEVSQYTKDSTEQSNSSQRAQFHREKRVSIKWKPRAQGHSEEARAESISLLRQAHRKNSLPQGCQRSTLMSAHDFTSQQRQWPWNQSELSIRKSSRNTEKKETKRKKDSMMSSIHLLQRGFWEEARLLKARPSSKDLLCLQVRSRHKEVILEAITTSNTKKRWDLELLLRRHMNLRNIDRL